MRNVDVFFSPINLYSSGCIFNPDQIPITHTMEFHFSVNNHNFHTVGEPHDISIPLNFGGPQPSSYAVPPAVSTPYRDGQWVGDVNQGGSCNFEEVKITPHCNGTHTESVGHLADEAVPVHRVLTDSLMPATLVTVLPQFFAEVKRKLRSDSQ